MYSKRLWVICLLLGSFFSPLNPSAVARSQDVRQEDDTRRLWNLAFKRARERQNKQASIPAAEKRKAKPKEQSKAKPKVEVAELPPTFPASATLKPEEVEADKLASRLVGLTLWRFRQVNSNDAAETARILLENRVPYTAERVSANTEFRLNDQIRLSLEIPRLEECYVYIIDREMYANGEMSVPYLIYPLRGNEQANRLLVGRIFDFPSSERTYKIEFVDQANKAKLTGEKLVFIISSQPLDPQLIGSVSANGVPLELKENLVTGWEKVAAQSTHQNTHDSTTPNRWTMAEKQAGEGTRILIPSDPLPQMIFRSPGSLRDPLVFTVTLKYHRTE